MAGNENLRNGNYFSVPVPANTPSGAPVKIGDMVGVTDTVPANSAQGVYGGGNADGYASVNWQGVFMLMVSGAVSQAQVCTKVYIDGSNNLTTTASGNTLFGYALDPQANGSTTPIRVKLHAN